MDVPLDLEELMMPSDLVAWKLPYTRSLVFQESSILSLQLLQFSAQHPELKFCVGRHFLSVQRQKKKEKLSPLQELLLDIARKKMDARIVISGPVPAYRRGSKRFSKLFVLQSWLRGWRTFNGLGYMDNWSSFWKQPALHWRDGLHYSCLGSIVLSRIIERAIH
ncbi:hypothetical protein SRHO_G00057760 [Serrasalmus rhombeus]